jgi:hypothetical protein
MAVLIHQLRKASWVLLVFIILCSCSVTKYQQPITNFQTATAVVTANTRTVMTELNRVQRDRMIQKHRLKNLPLLQRDFDDARLIDYADLKVRLDALDYLSNYVDMLVQIANNDAPEQVAQSASDLSGALNNLTATVTGQHSGGSQKFKDAFTTASPILADIFRAIAQKRIKEALNAALLKGEKPVNDLIAAIGDDLEVAFMQKRHNMEEERTNLLHEYNIAIASNPRNEGDIDELTKQIMAEENLMDEQADANPRAALNAMAKAHAKLVAYAHEKSPGSFAAAVEAIEVFAAVSKRLGEAALKLKTEKT